MTGVVLNLLVLYAGTLVINAGIALALWHKNREPLYRALFFVWASNVLAFITQGVLNQNALAITVGFSATIGVDLSMSLLIATLLGLPFRWKPYAAVLVCALAMSAGFFRLKAPFWVVAMPVCIAVPLPLAVTSVAVIRRGWGALTTSGKLFIVSSLLFCVHNFDFAFLRNRPAAAPLGFTIAELIVFALSISAPAMVLEQVTAQRARVAAELDAARAIQTGLLPHDQLLPGLEIATFMRPAESVGGDYFDICTIGEEVWLMVGDVTGHGLGAGLVMLMAQSTISAILHTRPDISPADLNFLANRVLGHNLRRLGEKRHMSIVSLRRLGGNRFALSGSHENIYVYRAGSGLVQTIGLADFPFGLGFLTDWPQADFRQAELQLANGDMVFLGTDGVTEASRGGEPKLGMFGEPALVAYLAAHGADPLDDIRQGLTAALQAFTGGTYHDDVSFILLRASPQ